MQKRDKGDAYKYKYPVQATGKSIHVNQERLDNAHRSVDSRIKKSKQ